MNFTDRFKSTCHTHKFISSSINPKMVRPQVRRCTAASIVRFRQSPTFRGIDNCVESCDLRKQGWDSVILFVKESIRLGLVAGSRKAYNRLRRYLATYLSELGGLVVTRHRLYRPSTVVANSETRLNINLLILPGNSRLSDS